MRKKRYYKLTHSASTFQMGMMLGPFDWRQQFTALVRVSKEHVFYCIKWLPTLNKRLGNWLAYAKWV